MANFNLQPVSESINTAIEESSDGYVEAAIGVVAYFGMTLGFERKIDEQLLGKTIAGEIDSQIGRFLDGEKDFLNVVNLEYLSINGDEEALTKLPTPGPGQPSKFPTVVKLGPAFKALVRANAGEARLLLDQDAPAALRFVAASADPEAAKNEWQTRMTGVVKATFDQLGIKAPESLEDWGEPILELLAEAKLSWPDADERGEEGERQFLNHYLCPSCQHEWASQWSATCDDECPNCGARNISPVRSDDL